MCVTVTGRKFGHWSNTKQHDSEGGENSGLEARFLESD